MLYSWLLFVLLVERNLHTFWGHRNDPHCEYVVGETEFESVWVFPHTLCVRDFTFKT